jgi:hypothetical protein
MNILQICAAPNGAIANLENKKYNNVLCFALIEEIDGSRRIAPMINVAGEIAPADDLVDFLGTDIDDGTLPDGEIEGYEG